jgi:single-stranded DNA-binding protein
MNEKKSNGPIGNGEVGITEGVESPEGKQIDAAISEANLEYQLKVNSQMKGAYEAVQKMISYWSNSDKLSVLNSYHVASTELPKHPTNEQINDLLARTLLARTPKDQLKRIIQQQTAMDTKLEHTVQTLNARASAAQKQTFGPVDINDTYNNIRRTTDFNQFSHGMNQSNFTLHPAMGVIYHQLNKELRDILRDYGNNDLGVLADKLGAEYDDGDTRAVVIRNICNRVQEYAGLITGRTRGVHHSTFDADEVDQVEDLLTMTSFAWIAGKVEMTDKEILKKRQEATAAKRLVRERAQLMGGTEGLLSGFKRAVARGTHPIKTHNHNVSMRDLMGIRAERTYRNFFRPGGNPFGIDTGGDADKGREVLTNYLKTLKPEQLVQMAADIGHQGDTLDETIDNLARYIPLEYQQATGQNFLGRIRRSVSAGMYGHKITNAFAKSKLGSAVMEQFGLDKKSIEASNEAVGLTTLGKLFNGSKPDQEYSDKIPVVTFNESGNLISKAIIKAVPVYITGQAAVDEYIDENGKKRRKSRLGILDPNKTYDTDNDIDINEAIKATISGGMTPEQYLYRKRMSEGMGVEMADQGINVSGGNVFAGGLQEQNAYVNYGAGSEGPYFDKKDFGKLYRKIDSLSPAYAATKASNLNKISVKGLSNINTPTAKQKKSEDDLFSNGQANEFKLSRMKTTVMSKFTKGIFGKRKIAYSDVIPVLDINKSNEFAFNNNKFLENIDSNMTNITNFLNTDVPVMYAGLQEVGLSANLVSAVAPLITAEKAITSITNAITKYGLKTNFGSADINTFATGGVAKAASASGGISSIMTGDSLNSKPNPEVVSVDWNHKKINVTPTTNNTASANTTAKSGTTVASRMTSSERNSPMTVSLSNSLVTYTDTDLDDGIKSSDSTALKVYAINNGLNTKVDVGDTQMTVADMIQNVMSYSANINQLLAELIKINATIAAKPTSASSSGSNSTVSSSETSLSDIANGSLSSLLKGN